MSRNDNSENTNQMDYLKYTMLTLLTFGLIVILWTNHMAKEQDKELVQDFSELQQATQKLTTGEISMDSFENLQKKYPDDFMLNYQLGYAYLSAENMKPALTMFKRALDLKPFLVENNEFMYQYALVLLNNKELESAKTVITRAKQLSGDENYIQRIENLLTQLEE
jgi:tetratricopeptide (TPR) repeat protein